MTRTIRAGLAAIALASGVVGMQTLFAQQGQPGNEGGWAGGRHGGRYNGPPDPQTVVRISCRQIARISKQLGALNLSADTTGLQSMVTSLINDLGPATTQCETFESSAPASQK